MDRRNWLVVVLACCEQPIHQIQHPEVCSHVGAIPKVRVRLLSCRSFFVRRLSVDWQHSIVFRVEPLRFEPAKRKAADSRNQPKKMKKAGGSPKRRDDYQLVSRLVQYAFRVFNLDMNGFFMKFCDVFDQTPKEMKQNGETLEQYEVFTKYEEQLDKHMDAFVTKEGFNSVEECFLAIERAVKTDKREHAVRMEELTEQLKSLEEEATAYRQQKALKDSAEAGEDIEDDLDAVLAATDLSASPSGGSGKKGGAKKPAAPSATTMNRHAPAMLYLQPLTLEQVSVFQLSHFLHASSGVY